MRYELKLKQEQISFLEKKVKFYEDKQRDMTINPVIDPDYLLLSKNQDEPHSKCPSTQIFEYCNKKNINDSEIMDENNSVSQLSNRSCSLKNKLKECTSNSGFLYGVTHNPESFDSSRNLSLHGMHNCKSLRSLSVNVKINEAEIEDLYDNEIETFVQKINEAKVNPEGESSSNISLGKKKLNKKNISNIHLSTLKQQSNDDKNREDLKKRVYKRVRAVSCTPLSKPKDNKSIFIGQDVKPTIRKKPADSTAKIWKNGSVSLEKKLSKGAGNHSPSEKPIISKHRKEKDSDSGKTKIEVRSSHSKMTVKSSVLKDATPKEKILSKEALENSYRKIEQIRAEKSRSKFINKV